jgi:hypothetical protein
MVCFRGKVLFVTDRLWLQGYKPSVSIADAESIVWVYRRSLRSDGDGKTRNLGTTVIVLSIFEDGPACG